MKKLIFLVAACFMVALNAEAQTPEYIETLQKMLAISGADAALKAAPEQMVQMIKQQNPKISDAQSDKLKAWMAESLPDLIKMMTPVFAACYTQKDLEEIIAFYQTPLGKKMVAAQPKVMSETMKILPEWSAIWTPKLLELMKSEAPTAEQQETSDSEK